MEQQGHSFWIGTKRLIFDDRLEVFILQCILRPHDHEVSKSIGTEIVNESKKFLLLTGSKPVTY